MFGVSILSIVIALGFEFLGHKARPKRDSTPSASPGAGASGEKKKVSAVVMFQHWSAGALYLLAGLCWSVAFWPVLREFGWEWFVVAGAFAFLGLAGGTVIDIIRDRKPDMFAFVAARLMPTLLLLTVVNWTVFTGAVGSQVSTYQQHMNDKSAVKVGK